jgi:hypothetical protein
MSNVGKNNYKIEGIFWIIFKNHLISYLTILFACKIEKPLQTVKIRFILSLLGNKSLKFPNTSRDFSTNVYNA